MKKKMKKKKKENRRKSEIETCVDIVAPVPMFWLMFGLCEAIGLF